MAVSFQRPILIGGVGLSLGLWLLNGLHQEMVQLGEWTVAGAIALTGLWWLKRQKANRLEIPSRYVPVDRKTVEEAIARVEVAVAQLEGEDRDVLTWKQKVSQLKTELDKQNKDIAIAIAGGKNVGKTSLCQVLTPTLSVTVKETPALFLANSTQLSETTIEELKSAADLAIFVTAGDLTETELLTLEQMVAQKQRVLLAFNKQDQYLPEERVAVLEQLKQRTSKILASEDVVAIAVSPDAIKVRKHQSDGDVREWMETPEPAIAPLQERLDRILSRESQQLLWATTMRKADILKSQVKDALNEARRDRALPVIEQYQWIAAATAFANPVPALDLLATGAINGQLVMDLGAIYQQKLNLDQAQKAAGTVGSLMLKLGLVELSTQTISGILKSHAITYVAGGAAQGVSAAYLTRLAGLSLIEYFQVQDISGEEGFNLERLGEVLKTVFKQNQRTAFLQSFVTKVMERIVPKADRSKESETATSSDILLAG